MASTAYPSPRLPASFKVQTDWPVLACLALLVVLVRAPGFGNPVADYDDQLYSFIGERMLHGEWPFTDWFDRKPFGLFAIFAAAHWLGGPSPMAYQALEMLFTLGGALLTYRLALPMADRAGATIAGGFYVVLITAFSGPSAQSEYFFVPLMLLAAALVRDWRHGDAERRALAAMLLCGTVLQIKYTVLPQCIFLGAWVMWGQWQRGANVAGLLRFGLICLGLGIAPTALVGLFYLAMGGWDQFWFANFLSFFQRVSAFEGRIHPRQTMWAVLLSLPLIGAAYYAARVAPPRDKARYGFYALWSLSVLATVLLPKTIYMFYVGALAPCIALLATPFYARASIGGLGPALALLVFNIHILNLPDRYTGQAAERRDFALFAAEVARHVDVQGQCLYVYDGPTALYRASGGCTMTRLIYPDHLNNALETAALDVDQSAELARILAAGPAVIVTASRAVTPQNPGSRRLIERVTNRDYLPVAHTIINTRIITAWARRDRDTTATVLPR